MPRPTRAKPNSFPKILLHSTINKHFSKTRTGKQLKLYTNKLFPDETKKFRLSLTTKKHFLVDFRWHSVQVRDRKHPSTLQFQIFESDKIFCLHFCTPFNLGRLKLHKSQLGRLFVHNRLILTLNNKLQKFSLQRWLLWTMNDYLHRKRLRICGYNV